MSTSVLDAIRELLDGSGIPFRKVQHAPTRTSEESARARGEPLEVGGKALLVKVGDGFRLFVLSAALQFDSAAVRDHFGVKKTRFATPDELRDLAGLTPGSVPPFGRPILPFDLFVDPSVLANQRLAFNAGSLTDSIVMASADWARVAHPTTLRCAMIPGRARE
jgi:prolyl-tRNA editing enzyme YbaK/EbsC (Cys-tRNA(Pro) deacylase)